MDAVYINQEDGYETRWHLGVPSGIGSGKQRQTEQVERQLIFYSAVFASGGTFKFGVCLACPQQDIRLN